MKLSKKESKLSSISVRHYTLFHTNSAKIYKLILILIENTSTKTISPGIKSTVSTFLIFVKKVFTFCSF